VAVVFPVKAQTEPKAWLHVFSSFSPAFVQLVESIIVLELESTAVQIASIDTSADIWIILPGYRIVLIVGRRGCTKDQNDRQRHSNEERAAFKASSIEDSAKTCRRHTSQIPGQETSNIWYSSSIGTKDRKFRSQTSNISSWYGGKEATSIYASSQTCGTPKRSWIEEVSKLIGNLNHMVAS
jgi:hypothetical protein